MGCCGSKHVDDEQDERARLLDESTNAHRYGTNQMTATPFGEETQVRELESLQRIVERTAGNLIDIPSTLHLERLQQQEAQTRSHEYQSALNTVKLPEQAIRKLYSMTSVRATGDIPTQADVESIGIKSAASSSGSSVKAPSVREVLSEKPIVDHKMLGWMSTAMTELHQATDAIDVKHVGDLIVTLSPPLTH